jgi:hypothetical protein
MDRNERQVIDELFAKLGQAEKKGGPRDAQAEAHVRQSVERQPAAPYYMAQAIIIQEQALAAAQARIQDLERELEERPAGGGFLSGLFGGGTPSRGGHLRQRSTAPSDPRVAAAYTSPHYRGPSFLGGAMQTAMGVAGGLVLGNLIADLLTPDATSEATSEAASFLNDVPPDEISADGAADMDTGFGDEEI